MMNCETYRAECDQQFDAGEVVILDGEHAAACADCAAYGERLAAMQEALSRAPLETPRASFTEVLKARLAQERAHADESQWWIGASAFAACALFVVAGWYAAGPINPSAWINRDLAGISVWQYVEEVTRDSSLAWAKHYWFIATEPLSGLASPRTWTLAVLALIALVSVNMAEAYRLRGASRFSPHRRN
ncbi:MAG: hypothetical protein SGI88_17340 [Candidatus Hydrogenedentes bacterium]|nr:hypothetical protein [Candidatus Hydrogenedentota bacterium]